jgi:hypothetical protein
MEETGITDQELFIRVVGAILDHPSAYMGGASHGSRRKAESIWRELHSGRDGWNLTRTPPHPIKDTTK